MKVFSCRPSSPEVPDHEFRPHVKLRLEGKRGVEMGWPLEEYFVDVSPMVDSCEPKAWEVIRHTSNGGAIVEFFFEEPAQAVLFKLRFKG